MLTLDRRRQTGIDCLISTFRMETEIRSSKKRSETLGKTSRKHVKLMTGKRKMKPTIRKSRTERIREEREERSGKEKREGRKISLAAKEKRKTRKRISRTLNPNCFLGFENESKLELMI